MNEHLIGLDFDDNMDPNYQARTREKLMAVMSKTPMSVAAYARATSISVQTMFKFLRGGVGSFATIKKIERYLDHNR